MTINLNVLLRAYNLTVKSRDVVLQKTLLSYVPGGGGASAWGAITGTLADQMDLASALEGKQPLSATLTATTAGYTTEEQTKLAGIATGATANASDAYLLAWANFTGLPNTLAGYGIADGITAAAVAAAYQPLAAVLSNTTASFTTALQTKLSGIATGATANSLDAYLLARANHTGTQAWSTITGVPTTAAGLGLTDVVKLTGGQTVAGVKTLSDPVNLAVQASDPAAPASGLLLYAKSIAGLIVPNTVDVRNQPSILQKAIWDRNIAMWLPSNTNGTFLGGAGNTQGNPHYNVSQNFTARYTSKARSAWNNVVTTANQTLGVDVSTTKTVRGNAPGIGGFFCYVCAGFEIWTNGGRLHLGMGSGIGSLEPSGGSVSCGFGVDSTDAGSISFMTSETYGSYTKAPTGLTVSSGSGYECYIYCAPNASQVDWLIRDVNSGVEASGTATTTLPVNTSTLTAHALASNAALTTAAAIEISVAKIYLEY
ncbi:MAG: hypothetical protein ACOH2H_15430 [Cypionkella sp.]